MKLTAYDRDVFEGIVQRIERASKTNDVELVKNQCLFMLNFIQSIELRGGLPENVTSLEIYKLIKKGA